MANESASLNTLNTVYRWVVDDVVKNVRDDFLNEGIDQQVLAELKWLWQGKIEMSRAVNRPSKHHLPDPPPPSKEATPRAVPQLIPMEKAALLPSLPQSQAGSGSVIQRAPPRQPPTPPTSTPSPSTQQTIIIPQGYPVYSIGPGANIRGMTTSSPTQPTVATAAAIPQQRPPGLPQFMPQLMMSHPGGTFPQGAAQVIVPTSQGAMVMPLPLPTVLAMQQQQQAVIAAARQAQARAQKEKDKVQQIDGPPPPVSNSGHHDSHATSQCLTPLPFREHSSNDESLPCLLPAAEQDCEKTECITGRERDHSDVESFSSNPRSSPDSTQVRPIPGRYSSKRCAREREIVQLDGACGGSSSEDDTDGDEDTTDEEIDNTVDDDPLNSDDDLDDVGSDKSDEGFETQDVVICQWEKVYRVKSKWKFILKDGIMNVGGHDYVFQKVTGEADW